MTPDLPIELWLHILGLLPKHYLRKLMSINRTLFELAMNEVYQEVRFVDDGKEMIRIFGQLKYPSISERVQHLYIRPGFFSQIDSVDSIQEKSRTRIRGNWWKKYLRISTGTWTDSPSALKRPRSCERNILAVAQEALVHFNNVNQLSIILYDLLPPPTFPTFLGAMWTNLGPRLSRLNIDTTLVKVPLLLDPNMARCLPLLTEMNLRLAVSRFVCVPRRASLIPQTILPFIVSLKGALKSFSLSSAEVLDLSPLFHGLGYFPHLQKLSLKIVMNRLTLSDPASLSSLIALHKDILQHLSVSTYHPAPLNNPSDASYETWVTQKLPQIKFPTLESLKLGLHAGFPSSNTITPQLSSDKLPNLISVTLTGAPLLYNDVKAILERVGGVIPWQTLRLYISQLTPLLIDTLATRLPHLTELDLTCGYVGAGSDQFHHGSDGQLFGKEMFHRTYPSWGIRRLRIAVILYRCGQPHVDLNCMRYIAKCLPLAVSYLTEDLCFCEALPCRIF